MDLTWIQERVRENAYFYSFHGDQERQNDDLTISKVVEAILSGTILESYEDTGRGPSCLVVGFTDENRPVHVVCGQRGTHMVIITVYVPGPPRFRTPFERG